MPYKVSRTREATAKREQEVFEALAVQPLTVKQMAFGFDLNKTTVITTLNRLIEQKKVVKVSRGLYCVPGSNTVSAMGLNNITEEQKEEFKIGELSDVRPVYSTGTKCVKYIAIDERGKDQFLNEHVIDALKEWHVSATADLVDDKARCAELQARIAKTQAQIEAVSNLVALVREG